SGFTFASEKAGNRYRISARKDGELIHVDVIDPANAKHRESFIKALTQKAPDLDANAVDAELLRIADAAEDEGPANDGAEVDVSRIVRPEQFFTADVCGLTVPVVRLIGDKPVARWNLYLRWTDGRRESRPLSECLLLPEDQRL